VVSSAELIQTFEARWTPEARDMHFEAGRRVDRVRNDAFALIRERLANGQMLTEFEVKTFFRDRFAAEGLVTDHGPIVGVNANASNPHYEPMEDTSATMQRGDWLLIDHWAKLDQPGAPYYDVTWTAFCGDNPVRPPSPDLRHRARRSRRRHRPRAEGHRRRPAAVRL
jgi:Xaa-Pro dipeptidase